MRTSPQPALATLSGTLMAAILGGALCAASAQSPPAHAMPPADRAALSAALEAYDQGKAAQAEPVLRSLSLRYPNDYQANEALGSLYAEANQLDRALLLLERSCKIAPRQALAHANLGAVYLKLNRPAEAVTELRRAATLDPGNAQTQSSLGQALMLQKQPAAAATAFAAAAKATPNDPGITYNLALAQYENGNSKQAAQTLESIPEPTAEVHALAADANERAGDFVKALTHFEAAARLDPSDPNLYALTVELLRHWNWEEAIKVANFGASRYPASRHFPMASGIAYYGKSDYPPAVRIFSQLLQQDPADASVADLLGRSCTALADGEDTGCAAVFQYALTHPGNAVMMTYGAVALLHSAHDLQNDKQNLDQAAALLQSAIKADPNYAEAYLRMGVIEQTRQHWPESAALIEKSITLNPDSPEAHYRLSRAYFRLGRKEEAQQQLLLRETSTKKAKDSLDSRMQDVIRFIFNPS